MLPFGATLRLVKLSAVDLKNVMKRAFASRNSGGWLQISGMKVTYGAAGDPRIELRQPGSGAADDWVDLDSVPDADARTYKIVSTSFLVDDHGDGYDIDRASEDPSCSPDLKSFLEVGAFPGRVISKPKDTPRIRLAGAF